MEGMFSLTDSDRNNEIGKECEIRPGGMLVQKRNDETFAESLPNSKIQIDVKYGSSYHQIHVSPRSTFGEVKKVVAEKTGWHPDDLKILHNKKEKSSNMFLDVEKVKHKSKLVLVEDTLSRERRCLQMINISNTRRIHRSLSDISSRIDKFAQQVVELEDVAYYKGEKISEAKIEDITGNLLSQLVLLQDLIVRGDLNLQKLNLERRAQKNIEILDKLRTNNTRNFQECKEKGLKPILKQKDEKMEEENKMRMKKINKSVSFMVSSTKWETFD